MEPSVADEWRKMKNVRLSMRMGGDLILSKKKVVFRKETTQTTIKKTVLKTTKTETKEIITTTKRKIIKRKTLIPKKKECSTCGNTKSCQEMIRCSAGHSQCVNCTEQWFGFIGYTEPLCYALDPGRIKEKNH